MAGQINRIPSGVMGFLGIKNFGRAPEDLSPTLAGTWELAPFYLNSDCAYLTGASAIVGTGNNIVFTAPEGQVLYVTHFSVFQVAAAASSNTMALVRFMQGPAAGGAIVGIGDCANIVGPRGNMLVVDGPQILMPGESLGVAVLDFAGVGSITTYVRYRSMPI